MSTLIILAVGLAFYWAMARFAPVVSDEPEDLELPEIIRKGNRK